MSGSVTPSAVAATSFAFAAVLQDEVRAEDDDEDEFRYFALDVKIWTYINKQQY